MNILCIGDIVGKSGREAVRQLLPGIKEEFKIDVVIANAENCAGGMGVTSRLARNLFSYGCDILTLGDHVWDKDEIKEFLNGSDNIIRPANFPEGAPGRGSCIFQLRSGEKIAVVNLLGRVFMRYNVTCPFLELRNLVKVVKEQNVRTVIVDMHAEATSEKVAIGHFIDGEVSAVVGTHTHIQTADEKILPKGTAYITDLGMTGPYDSVIGQEKEAIIRRFLTSLPEKFHVATENVILHGVVIAVDEASGKARSIGRIQKKLTNYDHSPEEGG